MVWWFPPLPLSRTNPKIQELVDTHTQQIPFSFSSRQIVDSSSRFHDFFMSVSALGPLFCLSFPYSSTPKEPQNQIMGHPLFSPVNIVCCLCLFRNLVLANNFGGSVVMDVERREENREELVVYVMWSWSKSKEDEKASNGTDIWCDKSLQWVPHGSTNLVECHETHILKTENISPTVLSFHSHNSKFWNINYENKNRKLNQTKFITVGHMVFEFWVIWLKTPQTKHPQAVGFGGLYVKN